MPFESRACPGSPTPGSRVGGLQEDLPSVRLSFAFSRNLLDLDTFSKSDPSRWHQGGVRGNFVCWSY